MLNIALANEQQQRKQNEQAAIEVQIERETDLHSVGKFDGLIGCEPIRLEEQSKRVGILSGSKRILGKKIRNYYTN